MTRGELERIISNNDPESAGMVHPWHEIAADRILAALAREREGEVTLAEGDFMDFMDIEDWNMPLDIAGQTGELIFRPAKGDR